MTITMEIFIIKPKNYEKWQNLSSDRLFWTPVEAQWGFYQFFFVQNMFQLIKINHFCDKTFVVRLI